MSPELFSQIVIIFLLTLVGYFARKKGILTPEVQTGLSSIVLNIAVPASILAAADMPFEAGKLVNIGLVVAGGLIFYGLSIPLMKLLARPMHLEKNEQTVFVSLGVFQNAAFIGYPIIRIFLPETGVFYAAFFVLAYNLFFFTYGIAKLSGKSKFSWRAVLGLNTVLSFVMILLYIAPFRLPEVVQSTLDILKELSTPLSMMVIGGMLAGIKLKELFNNVSLYLVSFVRLLAVPSMVFLVLRLLPLPGEVSTVILIMSALPCGSMTVMAAEKYDCAPAYASKGVLLCTLLFALTIPYIAFLHSFL